MARSRMLGALALTAALTVCTSADAAQRATKSHAVTRMTVSPTTASSLLRAATSVGLGYWGAVPCRGQVKVFAARPVAVGLPPDTDAWVTFGSPQGANNLAAPASGYRGCTVTFARWRWPTAASMREDWDLLCATMVHEIGHLLGQVHDATPGSVMAPVFTDASSVPPSCRGARPGR